MELQAQIEQSAQPQVVLGYPAQAQLAVDASDQPDDRAFHQRSCVPVELLVIGLFGLAPGGPEQVLMNMTRDEVEYHASTAGRVGS